MENNQQQKRKFTTVAYVEIEKSFVSFETPTDIVINLDKDNSFYVSKYDLSAYQFKNSFLFKPKLEKDYTIFNRIQQSKIKLTGDKLLNAIKEFNIAKRVDLVNGK